jgi:hypothetical protein
MPLVDKKSTTSSLFKIKSKGSPLIDFFPWYLKSVLYILYYITEHTNTNTKNEEYY